MLSKRYYQKGFTIVELLIVIVIIGILAALVVVAYNGIATRANNSQTIDVAGKFARAILLYGQDNGFYPRTTDNTVNTWVCLGTGYSSGRCANMSATASSPVAVTAAYETSAFNNKIGSYLGNKHPLPSLQQMTWGGQPFVGVAYWFSSGASVQPSLLYWIAGDTACPSIGGGTTTKSLYDGNTRCSWVPNAL